jgi:hypothetical protein
MPGGHSIPPGDSALLERRFDRLCSGTLERTRPGFLFVREGEQEQS